MTPGLLGHQFRDREQDWLGHISWPVIRFAHPLQDADTITMNAKTKQRPPGGGGPADLEGVKT